MFDTSQLPDEGFARLIEVMVCLRDPEQGCPWDLEQSLDSLKPFLVEECYEALDAIDQLGAASKALPGQRPDADPVAIANHREELGDVLLQVIFQAQVTADLGWFTAVDVARGIADKLIVRHPHVFGSANEIAADDGQRLTPDKVVDRWEQIKKSDGRGALDGVPRNLPALLRGQRVGEKAARVGFDWSKSEDVLLKVDEELAELREAMQTGDQQAVASELGDLLFALTSLARHLDVDAEQSLRGTLDRFSDRFQHVEKRLKQAGPETPDMEQLEAMWQQAKMLERGLQTQDGEGRNEG